MYRKLLISFDYNIMTNILGKKTLIATKTKLIKTEVTKIWLHILQMIVLGLRVFQFQVALNRNLTPATSKNLDYSMIYDRIKYFWSTEQSNINLNRDHLYLQMFLKRTVVHFVCQVLKLTRQQKFSKYPDKGFSDFSNVFRKSCKHDSCQFLTIQQENFFVGTI